MGKHFLERINKNINVEFEEFKNNIIENSTKEEIFAKAYKINFFNELYDYLTYACETDEECDEFSEDELKILLRFKENLIENLYIEFIDNEYLRIDNYYETQQTIKYFIERKGE